MTKILKIAAITALLGASASASAWWGGPGSSSFMDDFFGDGAGDFNFSMNTSTHGWGRSRYFDNYGYGYGPYAYGPYGYSVPYGVVAPYGVAQAPVTAPAPVAPNTTNR